MQPKVSVIVAVYNAEGTLRRCFDSLLSQSLKDMEVVVVDDGSTDGSAQICDEYSERDPRFRVFHKPNEGVSATRQFGLDHATGEYVIHLDADDFIGPDAYLEAYNSALQNNSDIVFFDILRLESGGEVTFMGSTVKSWSHEDVLDAMIYKLFGSLCNRLVRRDLFAKYGIAFPSRMQYLEDKLIMIRLLARSFNAGDMLRMSYAPKAVLFYDTTANDSSLTKVSSKNKFEHRMGYWRQVGEEIDTVKFGKTYYSLLLEYAFNVIWNHTIPEEEYKAIVAPYIEQIKSFTPLSARKILVLTAVQQDRKSFEKKKWIAYPLLLQERIRISLTQMKGKRLYDRFMNDHR